jgi:hypothetical protein
MSGGAVAALSSTVVQRTTADGVTGFGETCPLRANCWPARAAGAPAPLVELAPRIMGVRRRQATNQDRAAGSRALRRAGVRGEGGLRATRETIRLGWRPRMNRPSQSVRLAAKSDKSSASTSIASARSEVETRAAECLSLARLPRGRSQDSRFRIEPIRSARRLAPSNALARLSDARRAARRTGLLDPKANRPTSAHRGLACSRAVEIET